MGDGVFSTSVLDRVKQREKQARETRRKDVLSSLMTALEGSPIPVGEALIFGSLVVPYKFDTRSDIDVAVHTMSPRDYLTLKTFLENKIGREFDLVEIESCRFGDSIRKKGVLWTSRHS